MSNQAISETLIVDKFGKQNQGVRKLVETHITAVTVYPDQALVTRRGGVTLSGSEQEVAIAGLPTTLQPQSVRARGTGDLTVKLLGLQLEPEDASEQRERQKAELTTYLYQIESKLRQSSDLLDSLQLQKSFLQGLSEKSVEAFSQGLAQQQVGLNDAKALLSFISEQYHTLLTAIAQQEQSQQKLNDQLKATRQKLQDLQTASLETCYTLVSRIEAEGAGEFELEASYIVSQASWTPLYDLRLQKSGNRLHLTYLAAIQQNSGEDWRNVPLCLSTARPHLEMTPPQLTPWYIDEPRAVMGRGSSSKAMGNSKGANPLMEAYRMLGALPGSELPANALSYERENLSTDSRPRGNIASFELNQSSTIPSDDAPHLVTIANDPYTCEMEYGVIPQVCNFAYLQAIVNNPINGFPLLPGSVNVFRQNVFLGTTQLEFAAPGQPFSLNLGIEEGLQIKRQLVEHKVITQSQRCTTFAYSLKVANYTEQEVTLTLTEPLPISRNDQIAVKLTLTEPEASLVEMDKCQWRLNLSPNHDQTIYYQFTVQHPVDLMVAGLDI